MIRCTDRLLENFMKNKIIVIVFGKLKSYYKRRIKNKGWRRFLIFSSIIHAIIRIFLFESLIFLENGLKRVSISLINNIILLNENKIVVIVFGKLISTNYNR